MAIGATPDSVIIPNFNRVTQFVRELPPPKYPNPIDPAKAQRGWAIFESQCAACLWDLLQPVEKRPKKFYKGYNVYDFDNLGFVHDGPQAQAVGFLLDTSVQGNSNEGHLYGTQLSDDQKRDLMELLKTF